MNFCQNFNNFKKITPLIMATVKDYKQDSSAIRPVFDCCSEYVRALHRRRTKASRVSAWSLYWNPVIARNKN